MCNNNARIKIKIRIRRNALFPLSPITYLYCSVIRGSISFIRKSEGHRRDTFARMGVQMY